jgi:tRNA (guanine9-N1)-methyltransferase
MADATKHMDPDEIRKYQKGLKKARKDGVKRLAYASQALVGPKMIIDLSYGERMELIEKKSLAGQISHTVAALRKFEKPFGLHVVNLVDEQTREQLIKCGSNSWGICIFDTPLRQIYEEAGRMKGLEEFKSSTDRFSIDWDNTFYLSPDAPEALLEFDENSTLIVGGLIDRTVIKRASLS